MFKVRIFQDSKEKLASIDYLLSRELRGRDVVEISSIVDRKITLSEYPISLSEIVFLNGLAMTEGATYDYTISNNEITFNIGILPNSGHVLINYKYLNMGV